nr:hypothetical protein [Motilibacter deserti]
MGAEPEAVVVRRGRRLHVVVGLLRLPEHRAHPAALHVGQVLDQPSHAQRARRGGKPGLLVGQPEAGCAQVEPLLRQEGEQPVALVADRADVSGHRGLLRRG